MDTDGCDIHIVRDETRGSRSTDNVSLINTYFLVTLKLINQELQDQVKEIHTIVTKSGGSTEAIEVKEFVSTFQKWIDDRFSNSEGGLAFIVRRIETLAAEKADLGTASKRLEGELRTEIRRLEADLESEIQEKEELKKIKDEAENEKRVYTELKETLNPESLVAEEEVIAKSWWDTIEDMQNSQAKAVATAKAQSASHLKRSKEYARILNTFQLSREREKTLQSEVERLTRKLATVIDANPGFVVGQSKLTDAERESLKTEQKQLEGEIDDLIKSRAEVDGKFARSEQKVKDYEKKLKDAALEQAKLSVEGDKEGEEEQRQEISGLEPLLASAKTNHEKNESKKGALEEKYNTLSSRYENNNNLLRIEPSRHLSDASAPSTTSPPLTRWTSYVSGPSSATDPSVSGISGRRSSFTCEKCGQPLPPALKSEPPKLPGPRG